jgi:hypothetical protein
MITKCKPLLRITLDAGTVVKKQQTPEKTRTGHIGEVSISKGKLTQEQLQAALNLKENDRRKRLSDIPHSQNLVSGEDLAQAVAKTTGFEYVPLTEGSVNPTVLNLLD